MNREQPAAYVYIDLDGVVRPVGALFVQSARGRETATFHYASEWLNAQDRFALQPALEVSPAPHHTAPGRALFGAIADSAPDRWGQTLLRREERRRAKAEERSPRSLREIDFLLGVTDSVRQGALRFKHTEAGPFLALDRQGVPPLVDLPRLLSATERFLLDDDSVEDRATG